MRKCRAVAAECSCLPVQRRRTGRRIHRTADHCATRHRRRFGPAGPRTDSTPDLHGGDVPWRGQPSQGYHDDSPLTMTIAKFGRDFDEISRDRPEPFAGQVQPARQVPVAAPM